MLYMYALYACLTCMPYMNALYVCVIRMPYMCALCVCLYVCLTCMAYAHAKTRKKDTRAHMLRTSHADSARFEMLAHQGLDLLALSDEDTALQLVDMGMSETFARTCSRHVRGTGHSSPSHCRRAA